MRFRMSFLVLIFSMSPVLAGEAPEGKVSSNFDVNFGGRLKFDMSYDDSSTNPGDYILWVNPEGGSNPTNNDEFNMTAKESRFWFNIGGPRSEWIKTSGRLELDFYGSAGAANKANVQLRHAYINAEFPKLGLSILAGQSGDVFSPLVANTLNYTVGWCQGNIGYRRPQLRLTKKNRIGDVELVAEGAMARTIDSDVLTTAAPNSAENGETSGVPTFEGRLSASFPFLFGERAALGFSGHFGTEEIKQPVTLTQGEFQSWSLNFDLSIPISKYLAITGEYFVGENLDTYMGGICQGVDLGEFTEIRSQGGWIQARIRPHPDWELNVGYGADDPDNDDLGTGKRNKNDFVFANVRYTIIQGLVVGVEYSHNRTDYEGGTRADDNRIQCSMIYSF